MITDSKLDRTISKEIRHSFENNDIFLKNGISGIALFLSNLYKKTRNPKYFKQMSTLMEGLNNRIQGHYKLEIPNGISGMAIAIIKLYNDGLLNGDLNQILKEIDNVNYKNVMSKLDACPVKIAPEHINTLLDIAIYMLIRLNSSTLNETERHIRESFIFKIINFVYINHSADLLSEPMPQSVTAYKLFKFISILSSASKIASFNTRIKNILCEYDAHILSQIPFLGFNRLLLFFSLVKLKESLNLTEKWDRHIELLRHNIDINTIIWEETPRNDISLSSGIAGICMTVRLLPDEYKIAYSQQELINRFESSNVFINPDNEVLTNLNLHGLDGILGALYEYNLITKSI